MEYLTWTYLFRRLKMNPSFYGIVSEEDAIDVSAKDTNKFLSQVIEDALQFLQEQGCLTFTQEKDVEFKSTYLGFVASYYYMKVETIALYQKVLAGLISQNIPLDHDTVLRLLAMSLEFLELPVRHNEDTQNSQLQLLLKVDLHGSHE